MERMKTADGAAVVGIAGWSGAGKTTFLEKLVHELKGRGYRVGTVKHTTHEGALDVPGSDSYRHFEAGSDMVTLVGSRQLAIFERLEEGLGLEQVVARVSGVDILLVEGYKRARFPKVEVSRWGVPEWSRLVSHPEDLLAVVTDRPWSVGVPCYELDDAAGVADLLVQRGLLAPKTLLRPNFA